MNLDDFRDFPRSPPYFGYNSAGPENHVFVFYCFGDLYGLKLTGDFLNNPLSSGFNSVWQKRPSVSIFAFSGATGLGIEQTQSPGFRNFETNKMS